MSLLVFSLSIRSVIFNEISVKNWNFFFDFLYFGINFFFNLFFNFCYFLFNFFGLFSWEWSKTLSFFFSNIDILQLLLELFNFIFSFLLSIKIINNFLSSLIVGFILLFFLQFLLIFLLLKLNLILFFLGKFLIKLINCFFIFGWVINFVFWKHISLFWHILFIIDYICKGLVPLFDSILHLGKLYIVFGQHCYSGVV
jgi:hypothetical protein